MDSDAKAARDGVKVMDKKILVVDDESVGQIALKNIISQLGYIVICASSGIEAIDIAKKEKPQIIFMDIVMDGMDGYSACRELHNNTETCDIPVIFVSSKNQKADHVWAKKQGGRALISKPFKADQIIEQIALYK